MIPLWKRSLAFLLLCIASCTAQENADQSALFTSVVDEYWRWRLNDSPALASELNEHAHDDRLYDYSLQAMDERHERCKYFLNKLGKVDRNALNSSVQLTFDILKDLLVTHIDGYKWRDYTLTTFNFLEGSQMSINIGSVRLKTPEDFWNYIKRLKQYLVQIDQQIALMRRAIKLKLTYHKVSMARVPAQIEKKLTGYSAGRSDFHIPFEGPLQNATLPADVKKIIRAAGYEAIDQFTLPAYRKLSDFIKKEYLPNTRPDYGVGSLPNGQEFYRACLKWHLGRDASPKEIHETGLREVARIKGEMQKVMNRVNFTGSLKDFIVSLKHDKRFFFLKTKEQILQRFKNIIFQRIYPKLPEMFKDIPSTEVMVVREKEDGPAGEYQPPINRKDTGSFFVNLLHPETVASYDMVALAAHEAVPGHHLQAIYQLAAKLPQMRQYEGADFFYSVPLAFPDYTVYIEGWALYAEYLGEQLGIYHDDYELFGRYSAEMLRACRLVVDTGIHALGWSRKKAIDFMSSHEADPIHTVEVEVDRYITWPGQSCAYTTGEMKIKQIREMAEKKLGSAFDIREFHKRILSVGPMKMSLLEGVVNKWIASQMALPASAENHTSSKSRSNLEALIKYLFQ